jgi:hypothetical protein
MTAEPGAAESAADAAEDAAGADHFGAPCVTLGDCDPFSANWACAYAIAEGCAAHGVCVPSIGGIACQLLPAHCPCEGTELVVPYCGLPPGYTQKRIQPCPEAGVDVVPCTDRGRGGGIDTPCYGTGLRIVACPPDAAPRGCYGRGVSVFGTNTYCCP